MGYRKFDDPSKAVSQSEKKVYEAIMEEAIRKGLQSIANRVISGTAGTSGTGGFSSLGTGGTGGVRIPNDLIVVINGRYGTIAAQNNIEMPAGTQGAGTVVKYLISGGFGTQGTVTAGNEGASSTAALLPDLPDNHVALGYVQYTANSTAGFIRQYRVLTGGAAATAGTAAFVDLNHMPLFES
jgi:hypothetical protein